MVALGYRESSLRTSRRAPPPPADEKRKGWVDRVHDEASPSAQRTNAATACPCSGTRPSPMSRRHRAIARTTSSSDGDGRPLPRPCRLGAPACRRRTAPTRGGARRRWAGRHASRPASRRGSRTRRPRGRSRADGMAPHPGYRLPRASGDRGVARRLGGSPRRAAASMRAAPPTQEPGGSACQSPQSVPWTRSRASEPSMPMLQSEVTPLS